MKFVIILFILNLLDNSWTKTIYDEEKEFEEICLKEQNIEPFSRITKSKGYIVFNCMYEKLGFIKDGIIQKDVMLEKFKDTDMAITIKYGLRLCSHITSNEPNELAFKMEECFRKFNSINFERNWKALEDECAKDVKLSKDEYEKLQYLPAEYSTECMKSYAKCIMERLEFLKNNNLEEKVILETSNDFEHATHLKAFLKECNAVKEDNEHNTAIKLYECMKNVKEKYVQITDNELKMAQKTCLNEKNLNPNEIFLQQPPAKPTTTLKTYSNCIFEKMGFTKNGIVQHGVIVYKFLNSKYSKSYSKNYYSCTGNHINHEMEIYNLAVCFDLFSEQYFLKDWQKSRYECEDEIAILLDENYPNMKMIQPTAAVKYFAACVFRKLNFLKDNNLQENFIMQSSPDYKDGEYLKSFLNKCKEIKENEHTYMAYKLFQCMDKIIEELGNDKYITILSDNEFGF